MPKSTVTFIPAAPGFERLTYWPQDDGTTCVSRDPIVGWRIVLKPTEIDQYGNDPVEDDIRQCAEPITLETYNLHVEVFVKYPDGRVNSPHLRTWDDEAAWLAEMAAEHSKKKLFG